MIKKENIFLNQNFNSKQEVLADIYEKMKLNDICKDYIDSISIREKISSFSIGNNIAIPHGTNQTISKLEKSIILYYHLKKPIDWDGDQVQIVLGLAVRMTDQIDTLQNIAVNAMNEEFFTDLLINPTIEKIVKLSSSK